jgi:hypothetical protein
MVRHSDKSSGSLFYDIQFDCGGQIFDSPELSMDRIANRILLVEERCVRILKRLSFLFGNNVTFNVISETQCPFIIFILIFKEGSNETLQVGKNWLVIGGSIVQRDSVVYVTANHLV